MIFRGSLFVSVLVVIGSVTLFKFLHTLYREWQSIVPNGVQCLAPNLHSIVKVGVALVLLATPL